MSTPPRIRTFLGILVALALLTGAARAQAPSVTLSASRVGVDAPVTLRARGLAPERSYRLELRRPDGATQVEELVSGSTGALATLFRPDREGMWIVRFRGEGVHSVFGLAVTGESERDGAEPLPDAEPAGGAGPSPDPEPAGGAEPSPDAQSAGAGIEADDPDGDDPDAPAPEAEVPDAPAPDDAASEGTEPGEAAGAGADAAAPLPDAFRIDDGDVVALRGDEPAWRLPFPEASGPTGPLLVGEGVLWVPHGLALLAVDPATGTVAERITLPAPVSSLDADGADVVATVAFDDGTRADVRVADGEAQETVRFGTDVEAFAWLRNEAAVEDPRARLEVDPTNPWLYLRAGLAATSGDPERPGDTAVRDGTPSPDDTAPRNGTTTPGDAAARDDAELRDEGPDGGGEGGQDDDPPAEGAGADPTRSDLLAQAVERGDTFFDLAGIGAELFAAGEETLAARALDAAFRDFADRGYDPRLLSEPELREAYGFPLAHLRRAVAEGDVSAASFWAPWAHRVAGDDAGATREALRGYASLLRGAGDREGAAVWSARAGGLYRMRTGAAMDRMVLGVAGAGWRTVLALLAAVVLLYATLAAKYWRPQTLHLRHRREAGRTQRAWARGVAIRFFSTTEKLVLVLLMGAALAAAGLASWRSQAELPVAAGSGTLASAPARTWVAGLDGDAVRSAWLAGYAAQTADDAAAAEAAYEAAGGFAPAVNNLGALQDEERLYQRALELAPGLPEARYNLGRITSPSPFHDAYRPGRPLLVAPTRADLAVAAAGPWLQAIGDAFAQPWGTLRTAAPGMPVWLWTALLAAFFVLALALVVALFVPRPQVARNAPRTLLYHALALLVPGAGLADELWGVLLLAPWSILGLDALMQAAGAASPLGLEFATTLWSLGVLYAINVAAFVVELLSYRRRMRELKRDQPERARSFGLRA